MGATLNQLSYDYVGSSGIRKQQLQGVTDTGSEGNTGGEGDGGGGGATTPNPPGDYNPCNNGPVAVTSTKANQSRTIFGVPPSDCDPLPVDCAGIPGGSAYNSDCGCIGGTTGITECPKEIIDSVKNPCIKAQLNLALTAKTTIRSMLNNTFGGVIEFEDLSLTFTDVSTLPDTVSGDAGRASATSIYFDIRLNKNTLPTYSREYTLSTIYHEILHAYLYSKLTKGPDGRYNISTQHEDMANKYLILMTGALKIAFPGISDQEAWALSWGGLEGTNLYDKKLSQDQKDTIAEINRKHTNKSTTRSGTYCN